ncbi:MAG: hypothetical protein L6Q92_04190 [Phycisphaerae bacterium]|nr:hypothetical protein [Phycisphaerae bacterium]
MRTSLYATALSILLAIAAMAAADPVVCIVDAPTHTMPGPRLELDLLTPPMQQQHVPIPIPPLAPVEQKRNTCVTTLNNAGVPTVPDPMPNAFRLDAVPPGSIVTLIDMGTGELNDRLLVPAITTAQVGFPGFFQPFNYANQPAQFTAGIVTDVGELTTQVSAAELNFQTDGPIICQALFQRLAPRAPQYGAEINYAGDRLEIYFDPAYTVTQGGIIFGTTSMGQGNFGQIVVPAPPLLGDMNCDGVVNLLDMDPFILALKDPALYATTYPNCDILAGDFDGDGVVTGLDIAPFLDRIIG